MPLIPLNIPPGVYKNGTEYQSAGRWADANLVRWTEGSLRPIGGWRERSATASNAQIRGLFAWPDNTTGRYVSAGTYNKLYIYNEGGTRYDITPAGLTSGRVDAVNAIGYGDATYGDYAYGIERPDTGIIRNATTWSLVNWGEYLLACSTEDGKIYEWQLNTSTVAQQVSNAPVSNSAVFVTEERFVVALGAAGNPRKVQWSDQEDNTDWTATATNQAGDFELLTNGKIMCGLNVRGQNLILTTEDAHVMNFIGQPFTFGRERVGTSCGTVGALAAVSIDAGAVWMGKRGFHLYSGGAVQDLPCQVADHVFSDINKIQVSKVAGVVNSRFSEVTWFYPSDASSENDRYVTWNYDDNTWAIGSLARTSGIDAGVFIQPIYAGASDFKLYEHEIGFLYDSSIPFAETGPIAIGSGDQMLNCTKLIPDEKTAGDVSAKFKTRNYPNGTENTHGSYTMSSPTSVRFQGKEVRMRVEGARGSDWRVGVMRLEGRPGARR